MRTIHLAEAVVVTLSVVFVTVGYAREWPSGTTSVMFMLAAFVVMAFGLAIGCDGLETNDEKKGEKDVISAFKIIGVSAVAIAAAYVTDVRASDIVGALSNGIGMSIAIAATLAYFTWMMEDLKINYARIFLNFLCTSVAISIVLFCGPRFLKTVT